MLVFLNTPISTSLSNHKALSASVNNDFNNFTDTQKFIFLMINAEVITQTAKTCHAILSKRHLFYIVINMYFYYLKFMCLFCIVTFLNQSLIILL